MRKKKNRIWLECDDGNIFFHLHYCCWGFSLFFRRQIRDLSRVFNAYGLTSWRMVLTTSLFDTESTFIKPIRTPNFTDVVRESFSPSNFAMFCIFSLICARFNSAILIYLINTDTRLWNYSLFTMLKSLETIYFNSFLCRIESTIKMKFFRWLFIKPIFLQHRPKSFHPLT